MPGGSYGDGRTVRKDDPVPSDQDATLAANHPGVISSEQLGTLRQKQIPAGGRVVDVLGDLGDQVARQISIYAADHDAGNDRAGFDFKGSPGFAGVRGYPIPGV